METTIKKKEIEVEIVLETFLDFINSRKVHEDCYNFQMSTKIKVIENSFIRGFVYCGQSYYETQNDDGFKVLHQWSVSSSLNSGGFDLYVWITGTKNIVFFERNWQNNKVNRGIFKNRRMSVLSTFTNSYIKV